MDDVIKEMEKYAEEKGIPIMQKEESISYVSL